jgi:hypothetical protein
VDGGDHASLDLEVLVNDLHVTRLGSLLLQLKLNLTFTTGARQLVVQDAAVQIGISAVSLSSFTPTTMFKIDGSFSGKLHTTFFTPALMYGITLSEVKKTPVHSRTISHPRSFQGTASIVD